MGGLSRADIHILKIEKRFYISKLKGEKLFEIRFNDRDYRVGDIVVYIDPVSYRLLDSRVFRISYITDYEQKEGYIVFGEQLVKRSICDRHKKIIESIKKGFTHKEEKIDE